MKAIFLKTALFLLFLFYSVASFAQTKAETEQWILDKLRTYGSGTFVRSWSDSFDTRQYRFEGNYLIYSYKGFVKGFATDNWYKKEYQYRIPIWALKSVRFVRSDDQDWLSFTLDNYCKDCTLSIKDLENNNWSKPRETTEMKIEFKSSDPEENFIERFQKAIVHLKSFYPKPTVKETF